MTDPQPAAAGPRAAPANEDFVQSLARGLSVIGAFDADHRQMSLSEVAVRTGLSRAAVRRFLHTLVELGFVRIEGRSFALTPKILSLGTAYLSSLGLPEVAQPHLEALSADLGESTSAAVLDGRDIVYVARVATRRIMTVGISLGTRFPAYATSMGRVLLAGLSQDRIEAYLTEIDLVALTPRTLCTETALRRELAKVARQQWALVDQELELGLRSLAVPITDASGRTVAAINVSTSAGGRNARDLRQSTLSALQRTAAAISHDLVEVGL
jgi:IclR family pca regulon transcriptional regulator